MAKETIDICILTIITVELQAALKAFGIYPVTPQNRVKDSKGYIYYRTTIPSMWDARDYNVVIGIIGSAGNSSTAVTTTYFIEKFSPKICFLVGIAAGVRDKIKIGEVILSNKIAAYEMAAIIRQQNRKVKHAPEIDIQKVSFPVKQDLVNYHGDKDRLIKSFELYKGTFPLAPRGKKQEFKKHVANEIDFKISTIASGEKLLRDPSILEDLRDTVDRKIEGGDMESAGFYTACYQASQNWLVVRGISDFGDDLKSDDFHKFASLSAVTVLRDFIENGLELDYGLSDSEKLHISPVNHHQKYPHLKTLSDEIRNFIHPASNAPKFDLRVSICERYEDILTGKASLATLKPKDLLDGAKFNKLLLHAPGGSGKTAVMCEIAQEAINSGEIVFFLDFKTSNENETSSPNEITIDYLFDNYSVSGGKTEFDQALKEEPSILLLVDGLNEIYSSTSEKILKQLESLIRNHPTIRVIVADRMNTHPNVRFQRGTIEPLTETAIINLLPSNITLPQESAVKQLLSIPFFLDLQLRLWQKASGDEISSEEVPPREEMFEKYFIEIAKLDITDLKVLSEAAYKVYKEYQGRTFEKDWWIANTSQETFNKLETAGVIINTTSQNKEKKMFRHQLLHDFLTGYFIAHNEDLWSSNFFDTATFKTNAYEPISFAAELLHEKADELLVKVYDWSYMTTDKCRVDLKRTLIKSPISNDLEFALTVKNAEKMFEVFEDTSKDAKRRLLESSTPETQVFLEVKSEEEIFELVRNYEPTTERFIKWKKYLLWNPERIEQNDLLLLDDQNPIVSWTVTNTLRRMELSDEIQTSILMFYHTRKTENDNNLRWRIAHLLGRFPSERNIKLLFQILTEDSFEWAKYGAVRSLMEIASFPDSEFREKIISELISKLQNIKSPLILKEIRRTCLIKQPDKDWYKSVLELAKVASELPESASEKKIWDSLLSEIIVRIDA